MSGTSDAPLNRPVADHAPLRPGPVAWLVILCGFAVMGWALLGVFRESEQTHPVSWFTWLIGAALIHDGVLLPLVVVVGLGFAALTRPGLRGALRTAVAVGAVVTLASIPVVGRFGARPDNPTLLPLPAGRNLVILWCVLLGVAVIVGLAIDRRADLTDPPSPEHPSGGGSTDPIEEEARVRPAGKEIGSQETGPAGRESK